MMWVALWLLNGITAKSLVKFILATMKIKINDTRAKSIFAITIHLIYFREIFIEKDRRNLSRSELGRLL